MKKVGKSMKCYKCGAVLAKGDKCPKCGSDVSLYKKALMASDKYYNLGLAKAKIRDLTGAEESLKLSVAVNKNNINARNLLGLVYCEKGNIVEALSQWVISRNIQGENNPAAGYIKRVQSNQNKFDMVMNTIKKYNLSLKYAKDGNLDMALIQLKKVVYQNPGLIDAQLLLALIYIKNKEFARARKCLNAVIKIDRSNVLANLYMQDIEEELHSKKKDGQESAFLPKKKEKASANAPLSGNDVILPRSSYREPGNGAITIVNILVGVVIGAAMIWFLIIPAKYKGIVAEYNKTIADYSEQLSSGNADLTTLNNELERVKKEKAELEEKLSGLSKETGVSEQLTAVVKAANLYIANDRIGAAEALVNVEVSELPASEAKSLYNTIAADVMAAAANDFYSRGMSAYNSKNYEDSADLLVKAYKCDNSKDNFVYYAAKSYEALNNTEDAKKYYQTIIDEFSSSSYIKEAQAYVGLH